MVSPARIAPLLAVLFAVLSCAPVDDPADEASRADALTIPVLASCSEAAIRANAPPDAHGMLDRAYDWIHRGVPYCECVVGASSPWRSDCSGFVSMVWGIRNPPGGQTTYSFAGGPWDSHVSVRLASRAQLRVGDALNYPGNPSAGTGHIVLFGGWRNRDHTVFCSLEESHHGTPARVIERSVDPVYLPIRLATRRPGPLCAQRCDGHVLVDGDCDRHDCSTGGGRCVDDAHGARCVDRGCPAWGTDTVCLDTRTVIACTDGQRTATTPCTGANPQCSPEGTGMRCEAPRCPATGTHRVCLANGQIAVCTNGRMEAGTACGADTFCGEPVPGDARCEARACVASAAESPAAHDACATGGRVLHCDARGAATFAACPAGQACSDVDGHRCVAAACPATGTAALCATDRDRVVCTDGVVTARTACDGRCAAADGTPAHCVATACAALPAGGTVCLADGSVGRCDGEGQLTTTPCAAGASCRPGSAGTEAVCGSPAAPGDAGTTVPSEDAATTADDAATATVDDAATDDGGDPAVPTATVEGGCAVGGRPGRGGPVGSLAAVFIALGARRRRRGTIGT